MREKIIADEITEKADAFRPVTDDLRNTMHSAAGGFGGQKLVQFVVFSLGDEEFGVDIEQVSEIVRIGKFAPIPDSPGFVRGMANVRGTIIAVIDLKKRFALREDEGASGKHIIITREQKNLLGILVDEVTEVLRVARKEIRPAPGTISSIHKKYISGVITVEERMIILLDLKSVLSEEELEKVARLRDETLEKAGRSRGGKAPAEDETEGAETAKRAETGEAGETVKKKSGRGHEKNTGR